ncbi:P68 family surface lipoprotein [Mesomycoplasma molare]|uniref:Mycoplasma lipoprotein C-terminal domain-containing protein n=1 Tax=Mesomycoplasma molare TaxID=171288 RepID=A0ABY5TWI3_9BACT|nr:hypothetical protein [Mesomycoplasma molare]UWD34555.1 hypothetical protein NX772_01870 [Mesomycoplasma molare]
MKKSKLKFLSSLVGLTSSALLISCNNEGKLTYKTEKAQDQKIVLATAQSKVFPLMVALKEIIPLYNEQMKNEKDFLEIELRDSSITKTNSELELSIQQANSIKTDSPDVANIILGNQNTAFLINTFDKILNTNKILPNNLFLDKILNTHTNVTGEQLNSKIFNLPFNIADIDALSVNFTLLKLLFDFIEQGQGNIDKETEFYKIAQEKWNEENANKINSVFKALKLKESNVYSNLTVNNKTFSSINSILKFTKEVFKGLIIDETKIKGDELDFQIFTIDYQKDTFLKDLNNNLQGKKIWELKNSNNQETLSDIKYHIEDDKDLQENFVSNFNKYSDVEKKSFIKDSKEKTFYDIKYANNKNEWASWQIRNYETVFAFAAAVGYEQSVLSPSTIAWFANNNEEKASQMFASEKEVELFPQITKSNDGDNFETYYEGGSSLIPVSVDNDGKEDKATLLFLKWLYTGEVNYKNSKIKVSDLIMEKSGYVLPLKSNFTEENKEKLNVKLENLKNNILDLSNKIKNSTNEEEKKELKTTLNELITKKNYLKAYLVSYNSLDNFSNSEQDYLNYYADAKTSRILKEISDRLEESTLKNNSVKNSGQAVLKKIIEIIKSK